MPNCLNQKFGHQFPGKICTQCGVHQDTLIVKPQKTVKEWQPPKENKNLHTDAHVIANDLYYYFGKTEKFGIFLGVIKRIGIPKAYQILAEMKQDGNKEIKIFMWKVKQ